MYQRMINNSKYRLLTISSLSAVSDDEEKTIDIVNLTPNEVEKITDIKIILNLQDIESVSECISCEDAFDDNRSRLLLTTVASVTYIVVDYTIEQFYAMMIVADNIGNIGRQN